MALFENMFGTRPAGRGESPKEFKPKPFRKPGRLERNDPAAMRAYEEEKKAYEEDMQASIADTEKLLGKEWRKRAFEKSKAEESKRAQQALAERAAINRNIRPADAELPPVPKEDVKGGEMVDLPGGGKASADTIRMLYKKKGERQAEKEAKETAFGRNIEARYAAAYEANKKRYEEEPASRGFTPPKTREEENIYNRERMADFRKGIETRELFKKQGERYGQEYRNLKMAARQARSEKRYADAINLDRSAELLNEDYGGTLGNASQRQRYFNQIASDEVRADLEASAAARREIRNTQTGANEVSVEPKVVTTPQSTPTKAVTTPPADEIDIPEPNIPEPKPRQPFQPPTLKGQTLEGTLPGISSMPPIPTPKNATPAQRDAHNAMVLEEYEKNIIVPSFSEDVQQAFLTAKSLNQRLSEITPEGKGQTRKPLTPQQRDEIKRIEEELKPQREILKKEISELRKNARDLVRFPLNSEQAKLNSLKIATLKNQLSAIEKFFN